MKSAPERGALRYELLDEQGQVLASQAVAAGAIPLDDYLDLPVRPPQGQTGGRYTIRLAAPDASDETPFEIGIRGGDAYQDGALTVNNSLVDGDLIFHYQCPAQARQGK